ncbi:SpaH/EbpB family LPXTG-anchored major pilin [Mobiluncus mulieris]|uniref:SpaH/EbpB family LPXTG-anchored major pilin n=1 Tax=Mobiluncus mulieris TaxID=2052 RepID=A0A7Y0U086_9ACTO|nr:SpaH/EbpB family LPXTG-anchored major pilin [Mobiluncus mulieris]NMW64551.1 SpaH/EbpB family LPXTG-anchored major pilin [Mobiluncus mulieris]
MGHQKIRSLRVLALGLSLALAMIGIFTWAPLGHADPSTDTVVDKSKKGSITVYSVEGGTIASAKSDGTEQTLSGATYLDGSTFKLTKHSTIDVSTLEGMKQAKELTLTGSFTEDTSFGNSGSMTGTTSGGKYKFDNLNPGVYKLVQTKAPKGKQLAAPAIVVLPLTNPQGTGFMYDIHVYPKNAAIGSIKKVNITPEGTLLKEGAKMTFKISVPIPKHDNGKKKFTEFTITDKPVSGLVMDTDGIIEVKFGTTTLTKNDDYTVATTSSTNVKVTLTNAGLNKLSADSSSTELTVKVQGTITGIASASNVTVKNSASYTYKLADGTNNGSDGDETSGDDDSKTTFGYIKIKNVSDDGTELNNGEFTVGKCNATGTDIEAGDANVVQSKATTAANVGPIGPLANTVKLCVKQTKAPGDYALNSQVTSFEFSDAVAKAATASSPKEITITNTKASDFLSKLPLTGGPGVIAFLVGGALLLIAAVATMVRKRRQDQE